MKKIASYLIISLIILIIPFKTLSAQNDSTTVGFILANTFVDRWIKDKAYFEQKFNELGGKVVFIDCFDQVGNQIKAAKNLVNEKVDGIVIVAIDAVASGEAVKIAHAAGIPVLAYDRIILNAPLDYYVSFNSIEVGEQMSKTVINKLPKGNILYVGGPSEDYNSKFIRQGVFNILNTLDDNYKSSSVQSSTWTQLDAYLLFQDYLSNGNEMPDAVICAADVLTRGIVDVLLENNILGSVILTGQDAEMDICRMITEGKVEMTVYKPIKYLGAAAAETIWNSINDLDVETNESFNNNLKDIPSYLLEPIVVNKENIDETIIKDGYYTKEEIYGK